MNKLFFFDVDGTLCDTVKGLINPSEATFKSLAKLQEKGHKVILATGRPKSFVDQGIRDLNFDGYITSNGAYVEYGGEVVFEKLLDDEIIKKVNKVAKETEVDIMFEGQDVTYYAENNPEKLLKRFLTEYNLQEDVFQKFDLEKNMRINKISYIHNGKTDIEPLKKAVDGQLIFMAHQLTSSGDFYMKEYNKAVGIKKLLEYLGRENKDTYAFGDGENDIEMIEFVENGIAMGNSVDELYKVANFVTTSVLEDGISEFLNKNNLG